MSSNLTQPTDIQVTIRKYLFNSISSVEEIPSMIGGMCLGYKRKVIYIHKDCVRIYNYAMFESELNFSDPDFLPSLIEAITRPEGKLVSFKKR